MKTAKYARIVVRIAEREGISLRTAARLYQESIRFGIRNRRKGLAGRVRKAQQQYRESIARARVTNALRRLAQLCR